MQLLIVGDIGISDFQSKGLKWSPPAGIVPDEETKILFNWELPIGTLLNPEPRTSGPRLLSPPASIKVVADWTPGFVSLGTNHILDAGENGLLDTITTFQHMGFSPFGAGMTQEEILKPLIWETVEGKLAIINWVFREADPDWMQVPGPNCWPGFDQAKSIIRHLKQEAEWIIVLAHWSDELFPYPRPEDRIIAAELATAGADMVVCHHPHVVRSMEVWGSCPVFYSLGNYYFSDFSNNSGGWVAKWAPRNFESLGIHIIFRKGLKPTYKVLSFWQAKEKVILDAKQRALRRMENISKPLERHHGKEYKKWYLSNRSRFDKYSARWHFGIRRLGINGIAKYAFDKVTSKPAK